MEIKKLKTYPPEMKITIHYFLEFLKTPE